MRALALVGVLLAATPAAADPRRQTLIASVLEDFARLSEADCPAQARGQSASRRAPCVIAASIAHATEVSAPLPRRVPR